MLGFAGFAGLVGLAGLAGLVSRELQPDLKQLIWGRSRFPYTFPLQNIDFGACLTKMDNKKRKIIKIIFRTRLSWLPLVGRD